MIVVTATCVIVKIVPTPHLIKTTKFNELPGWNGGALEMVTAQGGMSMVVTPGAREYLRKATQMAN